MLSADDVRALRRLLDESDPWRELVGHAITACSASPDETRDLLRMLLAQQEQCARLWIETARQIQGAEARLRRAGTR